MLIQTTEVRMNQAVIAKYQKLLALASDNPESPESQSAFKKAGEFAAKHGISSADLEVDGHVGDQFMESSHVECWDRNHLYWDTQLIRIITEAFDCKVCKSSPRKDGAVASYLLMGTTTDVQLANWYWKFLKIRIARQAEVEFHLVADQKKCALGITLAVGLRLKDMYAAKEAVMTGDTKALVVVKKADVEKAFKKEHPHLRAGSQYTSSGSRDAFHRGKELGKNMGLSQPVAGSNNKTEALSPTGAILIGND
jgi:hypothetical protein